MENFAITSDMSPIKGLVLHTNFEEIKSWLIEQTETDRNLIVSEDSIAQAKKRLAELRKAKTAIDDYRKSAEKEWVKPFEQVKNDAKELVQVIESAIINYDSQIKGFENEIKKQKIDGLKNFFNEIVCEMSEYVTFERIYNPKWTNSGFKFEAAQEEIAKAIVQTASDVELIKSFHSAFEISLLEEYSHSGNIHDVVAHKSALETRQIAAEKREAPRGINTLPETRNVSEAEIEPIQNEIQSNVQTFNSGIRPCVEETPKEKLYEMTLKFTVTMKEAHWLKQALDEHGINYKKV